MVTHQKYEVDLLGVDPSNQMVGLLGSQDLLVVQGYFEHLNSQEKNVLRVKHLQGLD